MTRVGILSITVIFLIMAALTAGTLGYVAPGPIEVRDWYDLDAIRDDLHGSYLLMNDLDSATAGYEELASPTASDGKGWQPIGSFPPWTETTFRGFMGTFDGQGHQILDLYINLPDEPYADNVGLFGEVGPGGIIKGIGVVNAIVIGGWDVGGLVGWNQGTVSNSYSTGNSTGEGGIGGLVGDNWGAVSDSYSGANVNGNWDSGGLVGQNYGTVSNSYFTGGMTGYDHVGGLVGWNEGTVSSSYSTGSVAGNYTVGGLVGMNVGPVSNCYFTGNATGEGSVGGLVGSNTNLGTVINSYSTGRVTGNAGTGGLVGNGGPSVMNSLWDIETSGQAVSAGGTGKTTEEMQDIATFSGAAWEICVVPPGATNPAYTWNIVDGVTYPFLSWQLVSTLEDQQPIEITSVLGPLQPFTPAGPAVEITLKNVAVEPVISLTATLEVNRSFNIAFNVTPSNPLQPDRSTSARRTLIGGGFSGGNVSYPLTINATHQNGAQFVYTKLVQILEP